MIIGKAAFEACLAHLIDRARAGEEGVGLLAGPTHAPVAATRSVITNVAATRWESLTNVSEFPRLRYEVDPADLLAAYQGLEDEGLWPLVLVHSHLAGGAAPSLMDVRYATNPALLHMIVDLEPARPHAVLWDIRPGYPDAQRVCMKIRYQVTDLGKQESSATDLTRDVSGG